MDSVRLEKQIRIIPLVCLLLMMLLRNSASAAENPSVIYIVIGLGIMALISFIFRIYLEKKNGTFEAKRYYLMFFFLIVSTLVFLYSLFQV